MCIGMLRSAMSPDCAYCSWLIVSSVRVWRGCEEPCADLCTDTVKAFAGGSVMVKSSIFLSEKTKLLITGNLSGARYQDEFL